MIPNPRQAVKFAKKKQAPAVVFGYSSAIFAGFLKKAQILSRKRRH